MIPWMAARYGSEPVSYVLFTLSQVLFPLSFIYANDNDVNPIETSLLRGLASVLLNFFIARYYNMPLDFKYDITFNNMIKRNIILVIHGLAIAASQFYLPLPIVHTVSFFAPIFIFVIDYFQNGIKINKNQLYCLLASILGIICTINDDLMSKIMDRDYEMKTQFRNYISLDPYHFSLYGLALIGIMFIWAYGLLRVRTFYKNTHVHANFHLGLCFMISAGFLYPLRVTERSKVSTLLKALLLTGLPLALCQLLFVASIGLNKKTGQLIVLTGIPVLIGYALSYYRYGQQIGGMQVVGSILILMGVLGVIKCGKDTNKKEFLLRQKVGQGQQKNSTTERIQTIIRI